MDRFSTRVGGSNSSSPARDEAAAQAILQPPRSSLWARRAARVRSVLECPATALFYCVLTSAIVYFGVVLGFYYILPGNNPHSKHHSQFLDCFVRWDGRSYVEIAIEGYNYDPLKESRVAFFPAFPLLGRLVHRLTSCSGTVSNLLVAHFFLVASFILLLIYARRRFGGAPGHAADYAVLAFGLWPATFFFRMAYSEPLFLFLSILSLYAMERTWPLLIIALIVGAATATRPVGIGLLLPLVIHLRDRTAGLRPGLLQLVYLVPLACWGIASYMLFQAVEYGEPLAFAKTQQHFRVNSEFISPQGKLEALIALEPIWSVYDSNCTCYWEEFDGGNTHPLLSLQAANPVYYILAAAAIGLGAWRGWLTRYEWTLCAALLLIPYVTRSFEMCMASFARFSATAFPLYLVLGHLLTRLRPPLVAALLAFSAFLLGAYAALLAALFRLW